MNSPKVSQGRQPEPNAPGKVNLASFKVKSPQPLQQAPKMLPNNKSPMGSMQKQLSPVSRPLEKPKVSSTANLQSAQYVQPKPQIERVYSPNSYLEPQKRVVQPSSPSLTLKLPIGAKQVGGTSPRPVAPRMSEEPMGAMNSKSKLVMEENMATKRSMIQPRSGQSGGSSPTQPKAKRAPRMSEPVNNPFSAENDPESNQEDPRSTKQPSLINLPVVHEQSNSTRFMRNKITEPAINKKTSGELPRVGGEPVRQDSPTKTMSPVRRPESNDRGFIKKTNLTETVSTDSNSNSNSNYRLLINPPPRAPIDKSPMTPSSSPTRHSRMHKIDDFVMGKQLGCGKFGNVFVVKHKVTGFVCALKIIPKEMVRQENIINQLTRELKIQSCLDHPNIIKLFGFFDDDKNVYLLLELGSSGQLYRVLKEKVKFSEQASSYIVKQICEAIRYLHTFRIIHRDIKPQNIVIQQGIAKVCDFGWAVCRGLQLRSTFCGTPLYVSPEILKGEQYDERIDLWSIGILTYQLLVGDIPFEITREEELIKIISDEINFPQHLDISETAKDFILKILQKNPEDRLKISQLLEHPFLNMKASSDVCNELDL